MNGPMVAPPLGRYRLALGSLAVAATMAAMFELPREYFIAAAFVSTVCMTALSVYLGGYRRLYRPTPQTLIIGIAGAVLLYLTFVAGNIAIRSIHPFGIDASNEGAIYSLIASPANPLYLQVLVLLFDSVGYESFFRGVLQRRYQPAFGPGAPLIAAAVDSAIHVLTLNPLWVVTTFIVDAAWGLTYYHTGDLTSCVTSHFTWDVLIFILIPIH